MGGSCVNAGRSRECVGGGCEGVGTWWEGDGLE